MNQKGKTVKNTNLKRRENTMEKVKKQVNRNNFNSISSNNNSIINISRSSNKSNFRTRGNI